MKINKPHPRTPQECMISERGSISLVWLLAGSTKADYYLSPAHLSSVEGFPPSHTYVHQHQWKGVASSSLPID